MDEQQIQKSVIFGFPWNTVDYYRRHNDYIIDAVERYPNRLIGFCCFDLFSKKAASEAERCLGSGLSGVGELAVYETNRSSEIMTALGEVMTLCRHRSVPLLLHANEPVGHQYPGKTNMSLRHLYGLLKAYPENRIVLAHWGGGLFFYALMKKEVTETLKNVWFDTAASPYLYHPHVYRIASEIVGIDKILFGSDYPLLRPERYFKEMAGAGVSQEHYDKIVGNNAVRLLGLSPQ
jgi:predicted TIM-barrel fold metal-dependent hydrolase